MDQKKEAVGMKSGMLSPVPATLHLTGACSKPLTWQAHLTARAPHAEPMLVFLPLPPGAVILLELEQTPDHKDLREISVLAPSSVTRCPGQATWLWAVMLTAVRWNRHHSP